MLFVIIIISGFPLLYFCLSDTKKWELFQLSGSLSSNKIENVYSKYHWFFTKTAEKNRSKQIIMKEFGASGMYEAGYACSSIVQLCIVDAGIEPCCIAFCSVNRGSCFVIILYISPVFKSL